MYKVAFYGGSFNPPHLGHVFTACYLQSLDRFDRIVLAPVFQHPWGKELIEFKDRYRMCVGAFKNLPKVWVSDIEETSFNQTNKPNTTINTIKFIKEAWPHWDITLVMGSDVQTTFHQWDGYEELCDITKQIFIERVDSDNEFPLIPNISSTEIRHSLLKHKVIAKTYLPDEVYKYIVENKLYGT